MRFVALLIFFVADVVSAQVESPPFPDDPRIRVAPYSPGEIIDLRTSAITEQEVLVSPEERIQLVLLGDPSSYSVTVSPNADSFSLRQLRAFASSTLTVRTDKRSYQFMATQGYGRSVPYLVRFTYSDLPEVFTDPQASSARPPESRTMYKVTGNRDLRPSSIRDDGMRIYIQWAPSQAIPAVFAIDRDGNEETVNGYMRGAEFTVDRIYDALIFRIDKASATVRRVRVRVK